MSDSALSPSARSSLKYERTISVSELASLGGRALFRLSNGRGIFLIQRDASIAAMDHMCYHHGGPMIDGDIEDIRGVQWYVPS
jgi:nitrite reductase/ring-hydroxylating ferredoxin subunit